ncbi:uncharacterized protein LACBIDRAFT_314458 [Laccaria bicolor S238N-H82]|uniref:Predicted protein n=1 Tax=Laccaria bicolor (strain S238N-H82 / ATCC MYA-4686) TaxID=486041 RepID=B0DYL5_LACBS|nr:uncharacterized protein LACBIDRAFT_314458 [Laccaria bicolor S238N-H82]EDR00265.1 predicted protein [Laccaria bicolor S238N-H82]|eukprot:XP_001889017.1 predicted protein [Laccaria bicolor S238N-H82]
MCHNSSVIDLYTVGDGDKTWDTLRQGEMPFVHWLLVHGPQGEKVRVKAVFDGGAMVGTMCTSFFKKVQHRLLGQTTPSNRRLRVANGTIIPSHAVWTGMLELGGVRVKAEFEIFDSGGGWEFLFGKPLLRCFKVLHDFDADTVTIRAAHGPVVLCNSVSQCAPKTPLGVSLTLSVEQRENSVGGSSGVKPPPRQVLHHKVLDVEVQNNKLDCILGGTNDTSTVTGGYIINEDESIVQEEEEWLKATGEP